MTARWDRETNARLIELWEQELSIDGISERIDRTPSAVQSRASKLRLRRQPGDRSRYAPVTADGKDYWTVTDDNQLRAQMASGLDVADIARSLGRTVSSVHTRWKRIVTGAVASARDQRHCDDTGLHVLPNAFHERVERQPAVPAMRVVCDGARGQYD